MKLLMISGDRTLAEGKHGAFYNTLEEFHKYWERIDIITPKIRNPKSEIRNNTQSSKSQIRNVSNFENSSLEFVSNFDIRVSNLLGNVYIHPSPWPIWLQPFWILKKGRELYREHKFGLITVHEYPPFYNGIGARLLWKKIHVPYVLEIHHIPGYPRTADFRERFYCWLTRWFIKYDAVKAKAVRVVNQHQVSEFLIKAGVPSEKIKYTPSAYIDLEIFKPMLLEKKYDLIFIGRLVKNKGVDLLLKALEILSITYNLKPKTLIVGDGPMLKELKLETRNQKLETNIVFHGWAEDPKEIAKLLNQSHILIMPSYNEGGPRVVLEAMACGVPVLATQVGIVPDIIKDNELGTLINWEPEQIAEKILILFKNQELQEKFSKAGLELARQFEKKSAIKNYAEQLAALTL